jgi:hypothetical protein
VACWTLSVPTESCSDKLFWSCSPVGPHFSQNTDLSSRVPEPQHRSQLMLVASQRISAR